MKNNYYIVADIGDDIPSYNFVVKAGSRIEAEAIAENTLERDYSDYKDYTCREITADELLKQLTVN